MCIHTLICVYIYILIKANLLRAASSGDGAWRALDADIYIYIYIYIYI